MKKNYGVKLASLTLILSLSVSLAACGNNNGGNNANTSNSGSSNSGNNGTTETKPLLDPNAEPAKDPFGKFSPAIEVTTVHTDNGVAKNAIDGMTIEKNIYTQTWEDKLGIKLKYNWTAPNSQAEEKMNLMIASGDLPDFMYVSPQQFEKLVSTGQLEDMTEEVQDYATKYMKKYLTGDYAGLLDSVTRNGKIYGIPNGMTYHDQGNMLWIREDDLKKAGLSEPKSVADLDKVLEAFKNNDYDNKKNDKYPIPLADANLTSNNWGIGNAFFNMFHSYPDIWIKNSKGELENGMFGEESRENTRKALLKLQEYYKKGYIHPDFATLDDTKYNEQVINSQSTVVFGGMWDAWWPLNQILPENPNAKWEPVGIPSADDQPGKSSVTATLLLGVNVAKKGVKNPEALVKMENLFHDLNNNPDTMQFGKYNTDPKSGFGVFTLYPMHMYNPSFNYEGFQAVEKAMTDGQGDKLPEAYKTFYDQAKAYQDKNDANGFPPYLTYTSKGSEGVVDQYIKEKRFEMNEYTAMPTQNMLDNAPIIKKAWDVMFLNVVKGADIKEYDDFLAQYDALYGSVVTPEVNDWFKAKNSESIQQWFDEKK
ncbi:putative aldouronate transport system substrate-binding protein [Paenibacillus taihuensis]|uniref:Putative aldouronate transport system substrate-binding protein n=1 Tax=Paenibacillus taihuensis TaxID=1156355 RepID=A0A3D9SD46_9BACL|nr:extracellular solute-binding protein [Paenibacillus taihuensis]REE86549.1 putative aldouronate transport system substrate-binding protein [Paenibacillus taihuensis]